MKRPTVEEINDYMQEREFYTLDQAEAFNDHFESNGWMVGKSKMKSWQAAVRTWIRNAKKWSNRNAANQQSNQTHSQRQHQQAADAYKQMEFEHTESHAGAIRQIQ
ncbi:MAG: hypothetical protein JKY51_05775 [Opitutaceae bacterium]|nr:hypothetical protein [Opitutaceae bacterium]